VSERNGSSLIDYANCCNVIRVYSFYASVRPKLVVELADDVDHTINLAQCSYTSEHHTNTANLVYAIEHKNQFNDMG